MNIVYVLTNQAMPGMIKVGITGSDTVETRMKSLDQTGVPLPFQCYYAAEVDDAQAVEKAVHAAFDDSRVRKGREFFEMDPNKAKIVIQLREINDVTPRDEVVSSPDDTAALLKRKGKVGRFEFSKADVPVGAVLTFSRDETQTATVVDDTSIRFRDHLTSLSNSAMEIMTELGYNWKSVDGTSFWLYEGQTISERRRGVEERGMVPE
jgi:hypothetical protein